MPKLFPFTILVLWLLNPPILNAQNSGAPYALVESSSYASCIVFSLQDKSGKDMELPPKVRKAMDCPVLLELSPRKDYIVFLEEDVVFAFFPDSNKIIKWFEIEADSDGVSGIRWTPHGKEAALVVINQQKYTKLTRLYTWKVNAGRVSEPKIYDEKITFTCGSTCFTNKLEFGYMNANKMYYRTYDEVPRDLIGPESIIYKNLSW